MSPLHASSGDHRGPMRHESLMPTHHDQEQASTWMIGYLDIMTLLVALMVLIFTLSSFGRSDSEAAPPTARVPFAVPLPSEMTQMLPAVAEPRPTPGQLNRAAVSAALGVAGLPRRSDPLVPSAPSEAVAFVAPTPLALLERRTPPPLALPRPLVTSNGEIPMPMADFVLVLTDRPPAAVRELDAEAVASSAALSQALSERLEEAPYLADLEGVEVSRVAEGIKLRVEDRWLFPTATADLTEDGESLIQRLVEVIQRHEGEVAVEGHTDDRPIQTNEFPSNWVLSSARAIAVVHALERSGVDSQRLRAVGLADTRPLASNDTGEGRAQNRRVEVIIHAR